jgi:hypothetical protein
MDGIKGETLALEATNTPARPDVLLADKDTFALPSKKGTTSQATHPCPDNYDIIFIL